MYTLDIKPGSEVILITPDNPRLDGALAVVRDLEEWGAHVATGAAATGKYRAAWHEMTLRGQTNGTTNRMGGIRRASPPIPTDTPAPWNNLKLIAKDEGYTGDECSSCGSMKMRRNGTCLLCDNCGSTSGCS